MIVGRIEQKLVDLLGIDMPDDPMIYLGDQNIAHIKAKHFEDYRRYGNRLSSILSEHDYVGVDVKTVLLSLSRSFGSMEITLRLLLGQQYLKRIM